MKRAQFLASLLYIVSLNADAFALAGELQEPGVALPVHFPEPARTTIMSALRRPDSEFLRGTFINSFTSLKYGGDTLALNLFLDGLAKCPGVSLSVSFQADPAVGDCDWMVTHFAGSENPGKFAVRVNLKSSRIDLEKLVIPEAKGPALRDAE